MFGSLCHRFLTIVIQRLRSLRAIVAIMVPLRYQSGIILLLFCGRCATVLEPLRDHCWDDCDATLVIVGPFWGSCETVLVSFRHHVGLIGLQF